MKKRILCLFLAVITAFGLCACGGGGAKYNTVKSVGKQYYSIAFRNGDSTYHYVDKVLRQLSYEGVIDELADKWLGSRSEVSFPKSRNAMEDIGYVENRTFIIGVDLDSYPMCFETSGGYDGFDVELADMMCKRLGWQLKVQPIRSDEAFVELNSGNIDCCWGGVMLDLSSTKYTVLNTYMSVDMVIASKHDGSQRISGKTLYIGTAQYCIDTIAANERVNAKIGQISRLNGSMSDLFSALDRGDCDFILTTDAALFYKNYR